MGDENLIGENLMDLDLNQEPVDPPVGSVERFGFLLNELETAHGRIEQRIRQLEAVTARARQRQRWRQARNNSETGHSSGELMVDLNGERLVLDGSGLERTIGRGEGYKRDSSHLVAKALEMNLEVKKVDKEGGSFYDCNICLDLAKEPVLTCCGHLFCWVCFYQVSYIDSTSKECPVCKGEVSDSTVIPIYGNDSSEHVSELESGLKIPPRPRARRVESVRQQRLTRGMSNLPVSEALRRIRISLGAMGDQAHGQVAGAVPIIDAGSQEAQNAEAAGSRRERIQQVSRVLTESAASLSSLSSALNNAERLVEDLETVINNRFVRSDSRISSIAVGNPFTRNVPMVQSELHHPDSSGEINSTLPVPSSEVSGSLVHTMLRRSGDELGLQVPPSSSSSPYFSRRRSIMARLNDLDSRDLRETRRRRLN
ncbi:uncharacterized protein [Primulina huaijiensis]|uniref:uncharacterized protein n=1 Tax=Primulina huaijiensis TaxID=1492673 RepID=UPI003CC769BE